MITLYYTVLHYNDYISGIIYIPVGNNAFAKSTDNISMLTQPQQQEL